MKLQQKRRSQQLATNLLQKKNLKILGLDVPTKFGEVAILAQDEQGLVIVQLRPKQEFKAAIEMIAHREHTNLLLMTYQLMKEYQTDRARVDIITVDEGASSIIKHHKGLILFNG